MTGPRSQSDRDALTVEIVFAVVTGGLPAAVLFLAVASPALLGDPSAAHERSWVRAGGAVAAAGFVCRVVHVLWRLPRRKRG